MLRLFVCFTQSRSPKSKAKLRQTAQSVACRPARCRRKSSPPPERPLHSPAATSPPTEPLPPVRRSRPRRGGGVGLQSSSDLARRLQRRRGGAGWGTGPELGGGGGLGEPRAPGPPKGDEVQVPLPSSSGKGRLGWCPPTDTHTNSSRGPGLERKPNGNPGHLVSFLK